MYQNISNIRVRYGETDKMGFVYYGNYAEYFEVGRVESMRALDISYAYMEDVLHVAMPVVELNIVYKKAGYYDELLTIETTIKELPTKFIDFHQRTINEKGELLNTASVRLLFMDMKTKKVIRCPDFIIQKLNPYFE